MARPVLRNLIAAYTRAREEGDDTRALALLAKLEREDPREARWPKRSAEIHARAGDSASELAALRPAFERQVHAEQTTRAIATAQRILTLDPYDAATEDQLHLLYMVPTRDPGESDTTVSAVVAAPTEVDEIVLTEVVTGSRPVALGDLEQPRASEIPIDSPEPGLILEDEVPAEPATHADDSSGLERERAMRDEQALRAKLLKRLPANELEALLATSRREALSPGVLCIRQGELADCMFVILEGALSPIVEDPDADPSEIEMGTLEAGDFCGEIGLLTKQPRNASLKAIVESRVLRIERDAVRHLLRNNREVLGLVLRTLRLRLIDRLVHTHPLFACFKRSVRARLAAQFKLIEVRDGGVVIQEGVPDPGLFVVLTGEIEVRQSSHGDDKVLAQLYHGAVLGELSALYGQPAMASAVARGQCWLLHLNDGRFRKILDRNPRVHSLLAELGECRARENRRRYGETG